MRIGIVLLAGALAALQAGASSAQKAVDPTGKAVSAALSRSDVSGAGIAYNLLVEERLPSRQTNRPDLVLDQLFVELMVAVGMEPPSILLKRLTSDPAAPNAVHNLLLLATVEESGGENDKARAHYLGASRSAAATLEQRSSARIGLARLDLGTNPAATIAALRAIDAASLPVTHRWEVDLLLARAMAIQDPKNLAERDARLATAWAAAPDAGTADHAISRVAIDRAIAAGQRGDRAKLISLLAVDRSNRNPNEGQAVMAKGLPLCGEGGITPDDVAIIETQRLPAPERPGLNLIWASRPGVGQIFLDAARRGGRIAVRDGWTAPFALRCRSKPSSRYGGTSRLEEALGDWLTSRGAYPLMMNSTEQNVTQLASLLASRTSRYGANSIMLLPILLQLTTCLFPQVEADEQARARIADVVAQIARIIETNDAPSQVKLLWRIGSIGMSIAARTKTPIEAQTEIQSLLVTAAADKTISRDLLYGIASGLAEQSNVSSNFQDAVLTATLALFETEPKQDPRRRALALRIYDLRASNRDMEGARKALAGLDLDNDLCALANPQPRHVSSNIRSEDYPPDTLYSVIAGITPVEFDLNATGQAVHGRVLVSDPPYVFDEVALRGVDTIRYDPPRGDGAGTGCRGMTQNIRWQIPY